MAEEFEDVLVIRIRRPAGHHDAETRGMTAAEAEQRGEELAAMQSITVETAELAFVEELSGAWFRAGKRIDDVLAGRLTLGGCGLSELVREDGA